MPAQMSKATVVAAFLVAAMAVGIVPDVAAEQPVTDTTSTVSDGRIAFELDAEIYAMDSNGSNVANLSNYPEHDGHPLWSPDGTRLAFTSTRDRVTGDSGLDIYVVRMEDGGIDRVTWGSSGGPPSSWSPDGASIVYVSGQDGEIHVVDVTTGATTQLTSIIDLESVVPPYASLDTPSFSPDGSRIAYTERSMIFVSSGGFPPKPLSLYTGAIFVMETDGSNPTRLTNSPAPEETLKWIDNDQFPVWAPDGSRIAFSSDQDGADSHDLDLYVMNADGSGRYRLTFEEGFVGHPAWSRDGAKIAYSGSEFSYVINVDGSNRIALGEVHGSNPSWSSNGIRLAIGSVSGIAVGNSDGTGFSVVIPEGFGGDPVLTSPLWQPVVFAPVGLVDPATGVWRVRDWGGTVATFYYGNPGDFPFMGDWDCDGVDTPGLYRQSDGYAYLRNTNTQGVADITFFFGNPGDVPIAGDFNGDGCDTVSIWRPSQGRVFIINQLGQNGGNLGAAEFDYYFGNPGDKPFIGDFDGDGVETIGLHRESTGLVYFRNSHTPGVADSQFYFGNPGDRLIAGDWNGDAIDSPALYRPGNTTFYYRYTNTQGNADSSFVWGSAGWLPVAGVFGLGG